ncbi:hypothetical protein [Thermoleptolyngbya sp. M55_K2018_002]|uniref:hypothetical protein n=1 Tax=Thermoleptolyngbya sp. M55_K2018_002 TaxID=2747808 RepID=UPI0019DAD166|nr:hypothetical protein [Thermoleptolyngbya sp. M55_K2018_002]HIK39785.1 hypothetical protein [Thermoleptolyngbya sp. M55_K2018_002]
MDTGDKPNAHFKAIDTYFTDEGLVLVCPDEAEARRAYCEAQLKNYKVRLDGDRLILLAFGKKKES